MPIAITGEEMGGRPTCRDQKGGEGRKSEGEGEGLTIKGKGSERKST